ncbi:hypothetical protein K503DRAFT_783709 [Rhizopogon vinicolor AM-OR11-026]|uniref:Uncharacterized protein n=1 Tax=Rhizopogon vinicolor AM-OR11-026 TaxID=1314800 RepID=A0A1B7MXP1_9AGAM|nr:hypothetical protein K503DRAFT_783709 [Rhizopogon vinicolor AM-OR11-026]
MSSSGMFSFSGAGTGLNPRWGGESYSSSPLSLPILPLSDPFSDSGSCSYQRSQFQHIRRIYSGQLTNPGLARALPSFRVTGVQTDYGAPRYSQAYDKDVSELVATDKWDKTVSQGRNY